MKRMLFVVLGMVTNLLAQEVHDFEGKHFIASYLGCDHEALGNIEELIHVMDFAVEASGATILNKTSYVFSPNGLTIVYLLSESHASLHTYPECNACFVDLFTCGDRCTPDGFDTFLRAYLKPQKVNAKFFHRHQEIDEMPYVLR